MRDVRRRRRQRLRLAACLSRSFVDRHAPQVHASGAIAQEVQPAAVGRPDRIPVVRDVRRRAHGILPVGVDGPDVAVGAFLLQSDANGPVRDPQAVRRNARLYRQIARYQSPGLARGDVRDNDIAERRRDTLRSRGAVGRKDDPFAVGEPRRMVAARGDAASRLAGTSHHENAATGFARAERNLLAVRRERRHRFNVCRVLRQVDRRLACRALQQQLAVLHIHDPLAVGRDVLSCAAITASVTCRRMPRSRFSGRPPFMVSSASVRPSTYSIVRKCVSPACSTE